MTAFEEIPSGPPKLAFIYLEDVPDPIVSRSMGVDALVGYLATHVPEGVETKYWKFSNLSSDEAIAEAVQQIKQYEPQMIGISLFLPEITIFHRLISAIASQALSATLVVGGITPTYSYAELLEQYPDALMVIGEGEEALLALLDYLKGKRPLKAVPNVAYLDKESQRVVRTGVQLMDLRQVLYLPATLSLNLGDEERFIWIESSRGCMYDCSFCSQHSSGRREFPLERILSEIEYLNREHRIDKFVFSDDLFFVKPQRVIDFASAILEKGLQIRIEMDARVDAVYKPNEPEEKVRIRERAWQLFKEAGLKYVFFGIESGSNSQLQRYSKRLDLETLKRGIHLFHSYGINYHAGYILFDPLMDVQEVKDNLDFLRETKVHYHASLFKKFRVEKGTPYLHIMQEAGLIRGLQPNLLYYDYEFKNDYIKDLNLTPSHAYKEFSSYIGWVGDLYENETHAEDVLGAFREFNRQVKDSELDFISEYVHLLERDAGVQVAKARFAERTEFLIGDIERYVGGLAPTALPAVIHESVVRLLYFARNAVGNSVALPVSA